MRDFFSTDLVGSGKRCDDFELRRAFVTLMICAGLDWTDSENSHHFLFLATEASLQKEEIFSTPIEGKKRFFKTLAAFTFTIASINSWGSDQRAQRYEGAGRGTCCQGLSNSLYLHVQRCLIRVAGSDGNSIL